MANIFAVSAILNLSSNAPELPEYKAYGTVPNGDVPKSIQSLV